MNNKSKMILLAILTLFFLLLYILWKLNFNNYRFVLSLRLTTVGAIIVSGLSMGCATIIFHAISNNRIVTPSALGLEHFYIMSKTIIIFFWGATTLKSIHVLFEFGINLLIMIGFSLLLFQFFLKKEKNNIFFLLLIGIIIITLFQSISTFMQVLMDPSEYQIIQDAGFTSFIHIDTTVLIISIFIIFPLIIYIYSLTKELDILSLGKENAINLGVDYDSSSKKMMIIIAILVAISTSLSGPMLFLGLLILNITLEYFKTFQHNILIPAGMMIGILFLSIGQFAIFHLLNFKTELNIMINLIGGILFFWLLFYKNKKWQST